MDRRLKLLILCLFLVVIAAIGLVVYLRLSGPPSTALLLPEGNLLIYANLRPAHLFEQGKPAPARMDPGYRDFVEQTGIQFERDLDEVAISQKSPGALHDTESTALFTARFDAQRLRAYLQKISNSSEAYADKTIFTISHDGNQVRACILDSRTVAVTNMASAEPMRSMIDRFRTPAIAGRGPYLLQTYYRHVPATSMAWMIYRASAGPVPIPLGSGLSFLFPENTTSVTSLRYSGSLALKAEVFTPNETAARNLVESVTAFLAVYRSAGDAAGRRGPDQDVKAAIDSIQVTHTGNRAIFTATIPQGFLKKALLEGETETPGRSSTGRMP